MKKARPALARSLGGVIGLGRGCHHSADGDAGVLRGWRDTQGPQSLAGGNHREFGGHAGGQGVGGHGVWCVSWLGLVRVPSSPPRPPAPCGATGAAAPRRIELCGSLRAQAHLRTQAAAAAHEP